MFTAVFCIWADIATCVLPLAARSDADMHVETYGHGSVLKTMTSDLS